MTATLCSSSRTDAVLMKRQDGTIDSTRAKIAGSTLSRWRWITSSPASQRVDVLAEGQPGDRVDGEAHQVGLQVDGRAVARRARPARAQAQRHLHQRREVGAHMAGREAGHDHAALAPPVVALGAEHALRQAHLRADAAGIRAAPPAVGPVAHHRSEQFVVGDDQLLGARELDAKQRTVFACPGLDVLVDARGA